MDKTWIKLYRVLLEKPIWKRSTPQQKVILVTLLLMANHALNEWEWKGKKFNVEPGSFVTSLESIRQKAGYGISTQNVRSSLKRFEKYDFLTNRATKEGRIISITNWGGYQPSDYSTQQSKQQRGNKGATKTQHLTRMEEGKKKNKDKKSSASAPSKLDKESLKESSIPKIQKDIDEVCKGLYESKIFPDVHKFRNTMLKRNINPRTILHTLTRCHVKQKFDESGPWGYCIEIIKVEDGNYNERDYQKDKGIGKEDT